MHTKTGAAADETYRACAACGMSDLLHWGRRRRRGHGGGGSRRSHWTSRRCCATCGAMRQM
eukprot:42811-Eustigmatos_ZCMA.PRE.1